MRQFRPLGLSLNAFDMSRIFQLVLIVLALVTTTAAKSATWETFVKEGNLEYQRGRYNSAIGKYESALKLLDKVFADDLRSAIVHKNLSRAYKSLTHHSDARLHEERAAKLYKHELKTNQLGAEYRSKDYGDLTGIVLRPACPVCHENLKVVPIRYGEDSGYKGEIPEEESPTFTHKPGGEVIGHERWYCKSCMQKF